MSKSFLFILATILLVSRGEMKSENNNIVNEDTASTSQYVAMQKSDPSNFQVSDTAAITKICLTDQRGHETTLERKGKEWTFNGIYKAHPKQVQLLLTTLNQIRVKMPISDDSYDDVVEYIDTKVVIYQKMPQTDQSTNDIEKRTKVFYVGHATDNTTFMLQEGAGKAYIVYIPGFNGSVSSRFTADPDDWCDHTAFHSNLADIQSVEIDFNEDLEGSFRVDNVGKHEYKLTRLCDNKELPYDTLKVINMLSSFRDLCFDALLTNSLPQERIDSITHSPYVHHVVLTGKDGKKQEMKTFKRLFLNSSGEIDEVDRDCMYALVNNGRVFVLIQNYVFGKVLHDVRYFEAGNPIKGDMEYFEEIK